MDFLGGLAHVWRYGIHWYILNMNFDQIAFVCLTAFKEFSWEIFRKVFEVSDKILVCGCLKVSIGGVGWLRIFGFFGLEG